VYRTILTVLLGAIAFGLGALVVYALAGIVGGPFWDRMSERIEEVVTEAPAPQPPHGRLMGLVWSGVHTAASIGLWAGLSIGLLALEFVPIVGPVAQFVAQILATALFVARELLDPATTRRNLRYREKWALVDRHRDTLLGLGGVATLALMVPLVQFVAAPVGVAAATLWLLDIERRTADAAH
jgi:CysZ protein